MSKKTNKITFVKKKKKSNNYVKTSFKQNGMNQFSKLFDRIQKNVDILFF